MQKPTQIQIDEFTKRTLIEWCDRIEDKLKKSATKKNLVQTQALVNSIRAELKSGTNMGATISFLTYGRFIEIIGAKSNLKSNSVSTKNQLNTKSKPLTKARSRWYTRTRQGMIKALTEELVTDYATVIAKSTAEAISNK